LAFILLEVSVLWNAFLITAIGASELLILYNPLRMIVGFFVKLLTGYLSHYKPDKFPETQFEIP
jgi:hypothetical protein